VLDDLGAAVSLLKTLARTRLPREDQKHAITADQLRSCKVLNLKVQQEDRTTKFISSCLL